MVTKSISQSITFNAPPHEVYELIMDAKKHAAIGGGVVKMSRKPNGKFKVFDGYCHGYNIEIEPDKKIVQAWHFDGDGWPEDHYSTCTFIFEEKDGKTKLSFTQTGIPEHKAASLKEGWKEFYWQPMKAWLKTNSK